jgi:hypothetical protein
MNQRSTMVRGALVAGALLAVFTISAASAQAQTCGDADGNDTVTVTDGVQALRSAAGLSSSCDEACDVDGTGAITVSDGVNILRKAAGIAINEACEFTGQEANGVVEPTTSIFTAMTKVPGVGAANALAAGTGPCDNDGSIDTNQFGNSSSASFGNCRIGGVIFDGVISRAVLAQGVIIGFDGFSITRVKSGESHTINGQLGVANEAEGKRIAGKLTITSSKRGTFTMQLERILLAGDGSVLQGRLIYDVSKTSGGKIAGILIDFNKTGIPVTVALRDQQVKQFFFDPDTRLLVPAV